LPVEHANTIITAAVSFLIGNGVAYIWQRKVSKTDSALQAVVADKDKADDLRHRTLVNKIDEMIDSQSKLHGDEDTRFWSHYHDENGYACVRKLKL
jgi:predicted polyphosphate/ATP-dependent NAD kinase